MGWHLRLGRARADPVACSGSVGLLATTGSGCDPRPFEPNSSLVGDQQAESAACRAVPAFFAGVASEAQQICQRTPAGTASLDMPQAVDNGGQPAGFDCH